MDTEINTLPEIATVLLDAGFSISVTDDHNLLYVMLNRRIAVQEICDALGWSDIPENVGMAQLGNGVAITDDCAA